jgi:RimJ/RimL family protein N-acetyltransferase
MSGIRGAKVTLRAIVRADLDKLRDFVNDPEVMRFSNVYRPISDVEQSAWFESVIKNPHAVWFAVEDSTSKLLGTCCLVDIDWVARHAELRVRIGEKDAWGNGVGTETCALLVRHAFDALNLERVWLRVLDSNPRAQHVYEKLGFVVEGQLRKAGYVDGQARDMVLMGLLRSEWKRA